MFTLILPFVTIPLVGLAIDATLLFSVKAKLQAAVDGGAIAAAQSLNVGLTFATQQAAAQKAADEFIRANLVAGTAMGSGGYWGAYSLQDGYNESTSTASCAASNACIVAAQNTATKVTTVTIGANVQVPLLFMRIFGFSAVPVAATGQASRRMVVLVLVIDRSGSMGAELGAVQAGSTYFVKQFAEGTDKLGLVMIGGSSLVVYPPSDWNIYPPTGATGPDVNFMGTTETPNMLTSIANMKSGSNTNTAEGLMLAWKELQAANEPGALNIIVLWTDGAPNGITADFNNASTGSLLAGSGCKNTSDGLNGQYPNYNANSMVGWFAQWGGYAAAANGSNPPDYLMTNGIRVRAQNTSGGGNPTDVTDWAKESDGNETFLSNTSGAANGCGYSTVTGAGANNNNNVSSVINIPSVDWYGNSTQGSNQAPYTQSDYQQSALLWANSGNNCNYGAGGTGGVPLKITGTLSGGENASGNACQVGLASWNAADMAAKQIHGDTTLTPIIYTMGYAGSVSGSGGVDAVLLSRMANVPTTATVTNTVYNSTIPSGLYIQVQTVDDVQPAFEQLLSEILRLSL
jgi:Flp pilus assembly protein TadG